MSNSINKIQSGKQIIIYQSGGKIRKSMYYLIINLFCDGLYLTFQNPPSVSVCDVSYIILTSWAVLFSNVWSKMKVVKYFV